MTLSAPLKSSESGLDLEELLNIDRALDKLASLDSRQAKIVELRFFAGLTTAQTAEALGVSASTAEKDWSYARAWLRLEMTGKAPS